MSRNRFQHILKFLRFLSPKSVKLGSHHTLVPYVVLLCECCLFLTLAKTLLLIHVWCYIKAVYNSFKTKYKRSREYPEIPMIYMELFLVYCKRYLCNSMFSWLWWSPCIKKSRNVHSTESIWQRQTFDFCKE